jgi:sterol desaturase/sphingolipid hydroxylase (fatty acid hydroxylase superfamily)
METLQLIVAKALLPFFYPLSAYQRIYWLYLAAALVLAVAVYCVRRRVNPFSAIPEIGTYLFPWRLIAHRSAVIDYKYFFINRFAFALLITPVLLGVPRVAETTIELFGATFGRYGQAVAGTADSLLYTLCLILAFDAAVFFAHYLQHRIPVLWEFHKIHHSAAVLTPITVYRMHPMDDILTGLTVALFFGVVEGLFQSFYATMPSLFDVLGVNIVLFGFYMMGYNLRHSHVWLSYPGWVSHIFISPAQHQIHHSMAPRHLDRNMGLIFAFWDAAARTLYVPKSRENLDFGLVNDEHLAFDSVWQLYARPFRVLAHRYFPNRVPAP